VGNIELVLDSAFIMYNRILAVSEVKSIKAAEEDLCRRCEERDTCVLPCRGARQYALILKELYIYWKIMEN